MFWGMASELEDGVGSLMQSVRITASRGAVGSVGECRLPHDGGPEGVPNCFKVGAMSPELNPASDTSDAFHRFSLKSLMRDSIV